MNDTAEVVDLPGHPLTSQRWSNDRPIHPSEPIDLSTQDTDEIPRQRERRTVPPPRPKGLLRPSRKYATPGEMWAWHAARMAIVAAWVVVGTLCVIASATFITIMLEML